MIQHRVSKLAKSHLSPVRNRLVSQERTGNKYLFPHCVYIYIGFPICKTHHNSTQTLTHYQFKASHQLD